MSEITDASGSADRLVIADASYAGDLIYNRFGNDLHILTASDNADTYNDDGVDIVDYFGTGWTHGAGEIEYLQVGNSTYYLWALLGLP